jgi:hypothetical protein
MSLQPDIAYIYGVFIPECERIHGYPCYKAGQTKSYESGKLDRFKSYGRHTLIYLREVPVHHYRRIEKAVHTALRKHTKPEKGTFEYYRMDPSVGIRITEQCVNTIWPTLGGIENFRHSGMREDVRVSDEKMTFVSQQYQAGLGRRVDARTQAARPWPDWPEEWIEEWTESSAPASASTPAQSPAQLQTQPSEQPQTQSPAQLQTQPSAQPPVQSQTPAITAITSLQWKHAERKHLAQQENLIRMMSTNDKNFLSTLLEVIRSREIMVCIDRDHLPADLTQDVLLRFALYGTVSHITHGHCIDCATCAAVIMCVKVMIMCVKADMYVNIPCVRCTCGFAAAAIEMKKSLGCRMYSD